MDELMQRREQLTRARNALVETPFFFFRKKLGRKGPDLDTIVADLNKEIDLIDLELLKLRRKST